MQLPVISPNNRHQKSMDNPWEILTRDNSLARAKLAPETFVPPGISKLLHLWDPMTSDSSDGWGKLAERLIQSKDLEALGTGNEVLPSDEAPPHRDSTSRIRSHPILIPPRKIHFLDDHEDARRLMKYIIHENLHPRRRMINSASTAGSCPSPMIAGPSDPITPELQ
jgi:hypothetical protein